MNIEELKRLAEAATPGPWYVGFFGKFCVVGIGSDMQEPDAKYIAAANPAAVLELIAEVERLQEELELERMRLAACGVAAMCNTSRTINDRLPPGHRCYSASYADVCRAVDSEIAWRERAERAEAELKAAREQEPALVMCGGYEWRTVAEAEHFCRINHASHPVRVFYASPIPAPAVPEEWREVMAELADDLAIEIDQNYPPERRAYPSEQRKYAGEMVIVYRARNLLQSTGEKK